MDFLSSNCLWHIFWIFSKPCNRDPPTGNFKNFKFFKNPLRILNVYFWGKSVYFWGKRVYFWGNSVYFFWGFSKILGVFGIFFCCSGGFGAPWVGGPRRGFRKYLTHFWHWWKKPTLSRLFLRFKLKQSNAGISMPLLFFSLKMLGVHEEPPH